MTVLISFLTIKQYYSLSLGGKNLKTFNIMTPLKQKLKQGLEKRIYNEDEFIDEVLNFQKDILLNKLKEQYKITKKYNAPTKQLQELRGTDYQAIRLFCLDTQLISFNDIEEMEYEVNQSIQNSF